MKFLGKKSLYAYTIITILLLIVLSPLSNVRMNSLLANLTQKLIVQEVNPVRESYGFLKLETNEKLTKAAELKAQDMVGRGYFDHVGPEGETPWMWLDAVDYEYAAAGENLAMSVSDPIILIDAWLNSPAHARNILNGYFTDIGVGIAEGVIDDQKTTVVVMFLGRERTVSLGMASNITEEYKEIIISETESAKPRNLSIVEDVKPEEPIVIKIVEEDDLYKENLFLAALDKENVKVESNAEKTAIQMFLINDSPEIFRLMLTILYAGLVLLGLVDMIGRGKRNSIIVTRSIFLLLLTTIVWMV